MKAMLIDKPAPISTSPLVMREVPNPEPGEEELLLRVRCCAICRTDLHVIEGELPPQRLPIIPGHQIIGVVEKLGAGCTRFSPGQRVGVAWLRRTCGQCAFCQRGQENLCEESQYTGYHVDGGYAELAVVPEAFAYAIPDMFGAEEAAPLLCAGIIGYRSLKRANVPDGGVVALYGFGASAHVVLQLAQHRGQSVFVVSRGGSHAELARDMGADWVGSDVSDMPDKTDGAIVFAPVGHLVPDALSALRKGGTLALAGIHMSDVPSLNYRDHLFYERDVRSVTANTREDGRELFDEVAKVPIRTHTTAYPLADANRALLDLKSDRINGSGVLVV
jgi:propanol-preferring alcohol dehydrogenase